MSDLWSPYRFLTELASVFNLPEAEEELRGKMPMIRDAADQLIEGCPFPLTASTLYAMNYGVLYNYTILEMTNPIVQMVKRITGQEIGASAEDFFMLVLAEVARRILVGELDAPEMSL